MSTAKFFISIASFCDPHLVFTVRSAISQARYPQRLCFGVVEQSIDSSRAALQACLGPAQLRYTHVHPVQSRGVCWARALAFALYQDEELLLQIDSHTWFEPDWDVTLLQHMALMRDLSQRPLLTTYPWGFEFDDAGQPRLSDSTNLNCTLVLRLKAQAALKADDARLTFEGVPHANPQRVPLPGIHVAGGFLLTDGFFVHEVPYDPFLYFHGEEQSLTLRAYTRGWDIFHLPGIPLYHLYKRAHHAHASHHWHPDWDRQRDFRFIDLEQRASRRLADLLYQRRDLGVYGLGNQRSLGDYARFSGIDYLHRTIDLAAAQQFNQGTSP